MIFKPRPLSRTMLDDASLVRDKQHCRRIGPCGVGRRALYLNSYFIDRHYYVPFSAITRAFKFIEEGTGGVRGVLAGRACLLVEYDNGLQQVCCFKYEDQIDELLRVLHKMHPEIPCVSEEEEAELEVEYERRRAEERRRPPLSMRAEREIEELENAIAYLERKPELYKRLSRAAKRRRNYQSRSAGYRWAAAAIMVLGAAALIYGVVSLVCRGFSGGYLLLCLLAAVFLFGGWRLLPTARNNNAAVLRGDKQARVQMQNYIDRFPAFPLPARYAHPIVLRRMQQDGDAEAREKLIEHNLRLVAHIVKKYYFQHADQDDLISIGTIGLIKGISSFDPAKGARLATYAARCIENEILMHFRSQKKLQGEISLSESIESDRDGNSLQLMDVIGMDDTMLEDLYDRDSALRLRRLVKECLTQRESEVIRLRYGLGGTVPLTQREIASTFGISRSYVSRIEKRALEKLRAELEKPVGSGAGQ